jgi:hypothetical protein
MIGLLAKRKVENEMATTNRICRMTGQGLIEGHDYVVAEIDIELLGSDMVKSSGAVVAESGETFNVKNMHIAFDIEDILESQGA